MSTEEILAAALALPEADGRVLLQRLVESLPDEDAYDAAYEAELDRREAATEADPSRLIPGHVFLANLRARARRTAG